MKNKISDLQNQIKEYSLLSSDMDTLSNEMDGLLQRISENPELTKLMQ